MNSYQSGRGRVGLLLVIGFSLIAGLALVRWQPAERWSAMPAHAMVDSLPVLASVDQRAAIDARPEPELNAFGRDVLAWAGAGWPGDPFRLAEVDGLAGYQVT
jgi:hypothetical protein